MVLNELKCEGLNLTNFVGIETDGTSVMTGEKYGVVKRRRDTCPSLVGVHCAAHRCALSASQTANAVPEFADFSRNVTNVFRYFDNSSLRSNKLRE